MAGLQRLSGRQTGSVKQEGRQVRQHKKKSGTDRIRAALFVRPGTAWLKDCCPRYSLSLSFFFLTTSDTLCCEIL